jgi:hypothetical protein
MVILGGDDRLWVADGGGSGVMVVLGGGGVVSVLKSSPVWFFYLETKQLATATGLYLSRY